MSTTKSCRRPLRRALPLLALMSALCAQAAPIHWQTSQLDIAFDPDNFALGKNNPHVWPPEVLFPVDLGAASYELVANGFRIDFGGLGEIQSAYAANQASFQALVDFQPVAGYAITGYTLTVDVDWQLWVPSAAEVYASGRTVFFVVEGYQIWEPLTHHPTLAFAGSQAPLIDVSMRATGLSEYACLADDWDEWCDNFNGSAWLNLKSITLQAHVVPVPEPGGWALAVPGMSLVGVVGLRRRRLALATRL